MITIIKEMIGKRPKCIVLGWRNMDALGRVCRKRGNLLRLQQCTARQVKSQSVEELSFMIKWYFGVMERLDNARRLQR